MSKYFFLLKCPNCSHQMKYHTKEPILQGKSKKCVYCNKSFNVHSNLIKQLK